VSPPAKLQVEIAHPPESVAPARWRSLCRLTLGLDAASADILRGRTPATVHLALDGDLGTWQQRLERDLGAHTAPSRLGNPPRCTAHRAALISERCPRCESLSACGLCRAATRDGFCAGCVQSLRRRRTFRNVRVAILLTVLVAVGFATLATKRRLHRWVAPLTIAIVPVAADGSRIEQAYIENLAPDAFAPVARFLVARARGFHRNLDGIIDLRLDPPARELPPAAPENSDSMLAVIKWSLALRYWDWALAHHDRRPGADIRIYVLFHQVSASQSLDASVGLEQGHIGIVQAPIGEANLGWTELAVAHELLHTLGATDKYDAEGLPRVPDGLANPDQEPPEPQERCEVMSGSVPVEVGKARLARSLEECVVNRFTAAEIGWVRP